MPNNESLYSFIQSFSEKKFLFFLYLVFPTKSCQGHWIQVAFEGLYMLSERT